MLNFSVFIFATMFLGLQLIQASGRGGNPNTCDSSRLMEIKQHLFFNNEFLSIIPESFNSGKRRPLTPDEIKNNIGAIDLGDSSNNGAVITPEVINPLDVSDAIYIINSLAPVTNEGRIEFIATDASTLLPRSTKNKLTCGDGRKLSFVFKVSCDLSTRSLQTECK
jgi:hypothetical protein